MRKKSHKLKSLTFPECVYKNDDGEGKKLLINHEREDGGRY